MREYMKINYLNIKNVFDKLKGVLERTGRKLLGREEIFIEITVYIVFNLRIGVFRDLGSMVMLVGVRV